MSLNSLCGEGGGRAKAGGVMQTLNVGSGGIKWRAVDFKLVNFQEIPYHHGGRLLSGLNT